MSELNRKVRFVSYVNKGGNHGDLPPVDPYGMYAGFTLMKVSNREIIY